MLTALTIENAVPNKLYKRLLYKLRGNSIRTVIKSARGVALRDIRYINRTGCINWYAIDSEVGIQRNHLLCNESIVFPKNMGFKRFENTRFKIQLTCNLALYVLSKLKSEVPGLTVGVIDLSGNYGRFISELVNYCSDIRVISDNSERYEETSQRILTETGICVSVSANRDYLKDCPLVIAPERIEENIAVSGGAIVLTSFAPTVCVPGLVYFDYHFRMPNMFDKIKPESLSCEYFAGALYTKGRQYELGSIVPTTCSNFSSSQTPRSICEYLARINNS